MSPLVGFFLGILTVLVIFLPFWYLSRTNDALGNVYKKYLCDTNASAATTI